MLTIGVARRFATYKRAILILRDMDRLRRILSDTVHPVQLIFAGKAHPQDDAAKELIRRITELSRDPALGQHVVFIEDDDMVVARSMVQGVDVWRTRRCAPMKLLYRWNEGRGRRRTKSQCPGRLVGRGGDAFSASIKDSCRYSNFSSLNARAD